MGRGQLGEADLLAIAEGDERFGVFIVKGGSARLRRWFDMAVGPPAARLTCATRFRRQRR
jgi:hypothetical protein